MNRVLCISPHPDDETLGCGGSLLKHKSLGEQVYWLIVTNISVAGGGAARVLLLRDSPK